MSSFKPSPWNILLGEQFVRVALTDRSACAPRTTLLDYVPAWKTQGVKLVILREKDLEPSAYARLAQTLNQRCQESGILLAGHHFIAAAQQAQLTACHLPLPQLLEKGRPDGFRLVGTNAHSIEEALRAQDAQADYLLASPCFQPSCKPDVRPQGIPFLENICAHVNIPVIALGGITKQNEPLVRATKAAGAARMSDFMKRSTL